MKREDQRTKITKLLIRESFAKLVKEKQIQKISIRELCESAGINRGTFYTHYKDIDDLVRELREDFFASFKSALIAFLGNDIAKTSLTSEELIFSILSTLVKNKDMCIVMLHSTDRQSFIQELNFIGLSIVSNIYPNHFKNKTEDDLSVYYCYVSGGSIALVIDWLESDCKRPIADLANKLNRLITTSLSYFEASNK